MQHAMNTGTNTFQILRIFIFPADGRGPAIIADTELRVVYAFLVYSFMTANSELTFEQQYRQ